MLVYSIGCGTPTTDCDIGDEYWIGLVKYDGNLRRRDGWQWLDGTVYAWQNWFSGEPNNDNGVARYVVEKGWGDNRRTTPYRYICRKRKSNTGMHNVTELHNS